jgi:hypothetical protein
MIRTRDKLCIIGSAPSMKDAPYDDQSFDIWAVSGAVYSDSLGCSREPSTDVNKWNDVYRVDAFFEMHKRPLFAEKVERLASCGVPVIMQKAEADIPTSRAYPVNSVAQIYGEEFSSSVAYMFALAIHEGYKIIRFYGINLMHESEYASQRPGFKYYLGIARALGIEVWAPDESRLTVAPDRYGYTDTAIKCAEIEERKRNLEDEMNKQKQVVEDARQKFFQLRGAAQDCADILQDMKAAIS